MIYYTWCVYRGVWLNIPPGYRTFDRPGWGLRKVGSQYSVGGDIRQDYVVTSVWTLWL